MEPQVRFEGQQRLWVINLTMPSREIAFPLRINSPDDRGLKLNCAEGTQPGHTVDLERGHLVSVWCRYPVGNMDTQVQWRDYRESHNSYENRDLQPISLAVNKLLGFWRSNPTLTATNSWPFLKQFARGFSSRAADEPVEGIFAFVSLA